MNSPDTIASVLVGFSTVSFIVLFGIATFIPIIYELTILRKSESVNLLRLFPYRLISRFGETWSISILMISSIALAIISLLSLVYFILENDDILKAAIFSSIIVVFILIAYIVCMILCAMPYKEKEVNLILEYSRDGNHKKSLSKNKK